MRTIYQTLLGLAALSIVVGGFWIGFDLAQEYEFNFHHFMVIIGVLATVYVSHEIGGYFLKGK